MESVTVRKSAAISLSISSTLFLVLSSPFYLQWLAGLRKADWTEIGNIGQAYGAASAILSALALLGIAISVTLQVREHFANRIQIVRGQHFRLLELAMENPELYMPLLGFDGEKRTVDEMRQHLYTTMLVNYAHTGYLLGDIPENGLREEILPELFAGEPGRKWWLNGGEQRWKSDPSLSRKFVEMLEDEYEKAILQQGTPTLPIIQKANDGLPLKARDTDRSHAARIAIAALAGVLIGIAAERGKRKL
ncbi:MAG: hypothetical protein JWR24_1130 [Actinoallomurus sp.]|nr:hypothetical protein [Actinoallomurus sp.]